MTQEARKKEFLDRAKEADEFAANALNPAERDSWIAIANRYRELAQQT